MTATFAATFAATTDGNAFASAAVPAMGDTRGAAPFHDIVLTPEPDNSAAAGNRSRCEQPQGKTR